MKSFAGLIVGAAATQPAFRDWAEMYGVDINGEDGMEAKYNANVDKIEALNAENNGATFGVNQFSGMTFEEFSAVFLTNTEPDVESSKIPVLSMIEASEERASSIDWVAMNGVTPVKDQGQCGSCWAFSTMASVESVHRINTGKIVSLAEQQLVDCNTENNSGCSGGSATSALEWLEDNTACTTSSYPYRATQGQCTPCSASNAKVSGVNLVTARSEAALATALQSSPASISVQADSSWQHYTGGVLTGAEYCGHDHAVLLVGYTENTWKIKNSWGATWGEQGFIRINKGLGGCGAYGIVTSPARIPTGVSVEEVSV